MIYSFKTNVTKHLADLHTPVELYLKLRDEFPGCFLLESSEYKSKENSYSYLCLNPIASFVTTKQKTTITYPSKERNVFQNTAIDIPNTLFDFCQSFQSDELNLGFTTNGLFGYTSYDAIPFFEKIEFKSNDFNLPLIQYHLFKYLIVFNHFNNELYLVEHLLEGETSTIQSLQNLITNKAIANFSFKKTGEESSNFTDENFIKKIEIGKKHCFLGDVFQVVFSRKYRQKFEGDEFNVYRSLRSINPSPYLFFFDYGDFKIFGSSPEAQLTIQNDKAVINPIAGTFKRTGNTEQDLALADALANDPKEIAEHVMLVDLARNDLSKESTQVTVDSYKKVEFYSHVIHLVSKVSAKLNLPVNPFKILGNTYPAGTLSGAPKHMAMKLIDEHEPEGRGFYGGTIGLLDFNGNFNHAIFIRSFLSKDNTLTYQAGCGIVTKSDTLSELKEVENKLSALKKAIDLATEI